MSTSWNHEVKRNLEITSSPANAARKFQVDSGIKFISHPATQYLVVCYSLIIISVSIQDVLHSHYISLSLSLSLSHSLSCSLALLLSHSLAFSSSVRFSLFMYLLMSYSPSKHRALCNIKIITIIINYKTIVWHTKSARVFENTQYVTNIT